MGWVLKGITLIILLISLELFICSLNLLEWFHWEVPTLSAKHTHISDVVVVGAGLAAERSAIEAASSRQILSS